MIIRVKNRLNNTLNRIEKCGIFFIYNGSFSENIHKSKCKELRNFTPIGLGEIYSYKWVSIICSCVQKTL